MTKESYAVKGTHVRTSQQWVDERLGEGTFESLSRKYDVAWTTVLPSGWYDIYSLMRVMNHAVKEAHSTIFDAYVEISRKNASSDLTTIYRAFLRLAGPKGLLGASPTLWKNYVRFGTVEKVTNEPGLHIAIGRGLPSELVDWASAAWHGFIPTAAEIAGGKNAKLEVIETGADEKSDDPNMRYVKIRLTYDV